VIEKVLFIFDDVRYKVNMYKQIKLGKVRFTYQTAFKGLSLLVYRVVFY